MLLRDFRCRVRYPFVQGLCLIAKKWSKRVAIISFLFALKGGQYLSRLGLIQYFFFNQCKYGNFSSLLDLSGTYCHLTGPPSCAKPRQLTIYSLHRCKTVIRFAYSNLKLFMNPTILVWSKPKFDYLNSVSNAASNNWDTDWSFFPKVSREVIVITACIHILSCMHIVEKIFHT